MILNATSEYRVVFLYLFRITTILQTSILFKTNRCQMSSREPHWCGGPGAIAPVDCLNPAMVAQPLKSNSRTSGACNSSR